MDRIVGLFGETCKETNVAVGEVLAPIVVATDRGELPAAKGEPAIAVRAPLVASMLYADTLDPD